MYTYVYIPSIMVCINIIHRGLGSNSGGESASAESRVLATLLNEMDGVLGGGGGGGDGSDTDIGNNIYVFATTNRLDSIDAALLRKGRFHHIIHIPPPSVEERVELVQYFGSKFSLNKEVIDDLCASVSKSECYTAHSEGSNVSYSTNSDDDDGKRVLSGADIENMCRERAMDIIRQHISESQAIIAASPTAS